jgi:hypothetical protein
VTEETVEEVEIAKKENNPEEDAKANPAVKRNCYGGG